MKKRSTTRVLSAAVMLTAALLAPGLVMSSSQAETIDSSNVTGLNAGTQVWQGYGVAGEKVTATFTQAYLQSDPQYQFERTFTLKRKGEADLTQTIARDAAEGTTATFAFDVTTTGVFEISAGDEANNGINNSLGAAHHNRHSWDISVLDSADTEILGRVWAAKGSQGIAQPSQAQSGGVWDPSDLTVFFLSDQGWLYKTTYKGYNGVYSTLRANNLGIVNMFGANKNTPVYESVPSGPLTGVNYTKIFLSPDTASAAQPYTIDPDASSAIKVYKVFFNTPDPSMPEEAELFDGSTIVLNKSNNPVTPTLSNLVCTEASPGSTCTWDEVDHEGSTNIQFDVNGDGDLNDAVDVTEEVTAVAGAGTYTWDGNDGNGNVVTSPENVDVTAKIDKGAEIHFINTDAELRGGITNYLVNAPAGVTEAEKSTLYWDDTKLTAKGNVTTDPADDITLQATSQKNGLAGVNSNTPNGVHDLPSTDKDDGWGNSRYIQEWTYVPLNISQSVTLAPPATPELSLTKSVAVAGGGDAGPGSVINYTVTLANAAGTADEPDAQITDDLSDVLDDAAFNDDATVSFSSPTEPDSVATKTGDLLNWSGALAQGESATLRYSVTVSNTKTGNDMLDNVALGSAGSGTPPVNCGVIESCDSTTTPIVRTAASLQEITKNFTTVGNKTIWTITAKNAGDLDFTAANPAKLVDDMSGVLDDADYDADSATATLSDDADTDVPVFMDADKRLNWSGELKAGATVTLTYTATLKAPADRSDGHQVLNVVIDGADPADTAPGVIECDETNEDRCAQTVDDLGAAALPAALDVEKTAEVDGDTVTYTVTGTNTGQDDFTEGEPAIMVDNLTGLLDDVKFDKDSIKVDSDTAGDDEIEYSKPHMTWAGPLDSGDTVTITYTAKIKKKADRGDSKLYNVVIDGTNPTIIPVGAFTCDDDNIIVDCADTLNRLAGASLPDTGAPVSLALLLGGIGAVAVGGGLVIAGRKKDEALV